MNSELRWKFIFIAAVILLCIYGLIGVPTFPTSWSQIKQNLADRIKLGLDLKGGSHLVLQVQVDEAIGQRCDQAVDQITKQVHEKNITVGEISRVDDTHILVRNVDPNTSGAFRDLVNNQFTDWALSPAAGEANGYVLAMKLSIVADIRRDTMDEALETITRRINELGLTEPTIAFTGRGDNEILVELPGEGDPTRAKSVIQAGGQLELKRVVDDQTFPSESAARASHGGVLPPGTEIVVGKAESTQAGQPTQQVYYILDRAPIITGQDLRGATPAPSSNYPGQYEVRFQLSRPQPRGSGPSRKRKSAIEWPSSWITRFIPLRRLTAALRTPELLKVISARNLRKICHSCCEQGRCRPRSNTLKSAQWGRLWGPIPSAKVSGHPSGASSL